MVRTHTKPLIRPDRWTDLDVEVDAMRRVSALDPEHLDPVLTAYVEDGSDETKQSFVYDLQEPFRWTADVTVMEAFESKVLDLPVSTSQAMTTGIASKRKRNSDSSICYVNDSIRVRYKGRALKWDTAIEQKTVELGRCLAGQNNELDFSEPSPNPSGTDERELRRRILGISQKEALRLGIGKSTLHYLRKRARSDRSFQTHDRVRR